MIFISALALGACARTPHQPAEVRAPVARSTEPPAKHPPVVVALVVDQLPMWMAVERWKTLPATGGFRKLLVEANAIAELHHGHAFNATAPGHAALFTGGPAHTSGVTANGKLDARGTYESFLADPTAHIVNATGASDRTSSSIASLKAATIADSLKHARPGATVISLSMKDRGAIFGGGRTSDATLWFDSTSDAFVTSTAFAASVPAWAAPIATPGAAAKYRTEAWVPLDPKWLAANTDLPAPDLGQGDFHGLGKKFPHDIAKAAKPAKAFVATPFADKMLLDAAILAVDHVAKQSEPALIAVSLSSTDYVGHMFGPDAPEAWDQMLRLDAELARFFAHLDEKLGKDGYSVVLSADHGVPSTPEVMNQGFCGRPDADKYERRCEHAVRMRGSELAKVAEDAVDRAVGSGEWVLGYVEPFVVFRPATRALPKDKLDAAVAAVAQSIGALPTVARAVDVRANPATCPPAKDESLDALVCRSIHGGTGGDVFVVPKPGCFVDAEYVEGDGVNHGTPYLFDRAVPIIVRAPVDASVQLQETMPSLEDRAIVDQRAYAATIAALFGIEPPEAAIGGADLSKR
ncbi:MAG: hypothetical protein HOW73_14030 [Polyangiaceae bacterium]|nr:hypothetical protein [Polyangiaceae bacterium]